MESRKPLSYQTRTQRSHMGMCVANRLLLGMYVHSQTETRKKQSHICNRDASAAARCIEVSELPQQRDGSLPRGWSTPRLTVTFAKQLFLWVVRLFVVGVQPVVYITADFVSVDNSFYLIASALVHPFGGARQIPKVWKYCYGKTPLWYRTCGYQHMGVIRSTFSSRCSA